MTIKEQEVAFQNMVDSMKTVIFKKGNDYANTDRLSNFKLAGQICGMTPELNCLNLIATKIARLGVLLQNNSEAPNNESVADSILDLANYAVLLNMIHIEDARPSPLPSPQVVKYIENSDGSVEI